MQSFFVLLLGTFLINIELTAVNLALDQVANTFSIPISKTSNILSLYLAFFAVFTVIGGKLGDVFGRKTIIILMMLIFILASFIGGIGDSYSVLLIARSLQGLSAGAALPNFTAVLYDNNPGNKKYFIIGMISAVVGFSTATGPLIGSLITHYFDWRYIFYLNIPVGLIIVIFGLIFLPEKIRSFRFYHIRSIDYKGMFLTISALLILIYSIDIFPNFNFTDISIFIVLFIIVSYFWLLHHKNSDQPFLTVHLFSKNSYLIGCFVRMFLGFCYYVILYVLGIYSQKVLHFKLSISGLIYLPMTLSVTISSLFYSKISKVISTVKLLRVGLSFFLVGILIFIFQFNSILMIIFSLIIMGLSYGVLYSVLFTLTLNGIQKENTSEASGSLYFFNLLGGTIGIAFTGVLLAVIKRQRIERILFLSVHDMLIVCSIAICLCIVTSLFFINDKSIFNNN